MTDGIPVYPLTDELEAQLARVRARFPEASQAIGVLLPRLPPGGGIRAFIEELLGLLVLYHDRARCTRPETDAEMAGRLRKLGEALATHQKVDLAARMERVREIHLGEATSTETTEAN